MKVRLSIFLFHIRRLFLAYIFGLFVFLLARLVFFIRINTGGVFGSYTGDFFKSLYVGAKFDTMVLLYGMLLPFLLIVFTLFNTGRRFQNVVTAFSKYFIAFILLLFIVILIIDIFYYDFFQSHISVLFFGFFEDDTEAVMKSVWTDYPLIRVLLVFMFLIGIVIYTVNKIFKKTEVIDTLPSLRGASLLSVAILGLYAIGLRGSLDTFPLQIDDATISGNNTINQLPINGVFALKEAWMTRQRQMDMDGNIKWLRQIGYDNQEKAVSDYYNLQGHTGDNFQLQHAYFKRTPVNDQLKQHPPHVVFFQMESMSNYNMGFHSEQLNLLGHLEKYWNSEIVFRKCLPFGNGTINTLEGFLVNTPVTSLAQSNYRYIKYGSSVAIPFKNAGYQTSYITGGKLGWRNINEFIPKQGFDFVEGNASIQQAVDGTQQSEWGVFDEYLFEYVFQKLEKSNGRPQMIFAMTTTNHTPFYLPASYKPFPVVIPKSVKNHLLTDEKMAVSNFTNLQYANDCLGRFLDKLKASPFAQNTIVVATGDHNNLMLFEFDDHEILERRGVPLFMSVPLAYMGAYHSDTSLFVSHRDIFPTLISLSLSDASYFNGGNFLFDAALPKENYFAIDLMSKEAIGEAGAVRFDPQPEFYKWNGTKTILTKTTESNPDLELLSVKCRSYYASMSYYIKSEIDGNQAK